MSAWERSSTARVVPPARPRKLAKVPFAELADGRLQGVVSSGSDIARVYVSSIAAGSYAYACSTNNNRPCGGARGSFCNHLRALINEAVLQYGAERVARYLKVDGADGEATAQSLAADMTAARPPHGDAAAAAPSSAASCATSPICNSPRPPPRCRNSSGSRRPGPWRRERSRTRPVRGRRSLPIRSPGPSPGSTKRCRRSTPSTGSSSPGCSAPDRTRPPD